MSITFLLFLDHCFLKHEKKYTWVVRKWSRSVSGAPTVVWPVFLPILCVALRKYVKYQRKVSRHRNLLLKKNINLVIKILGSYFSHACPCGCRCTCGYFFYHMTVVTCTRFKVYFLNILYKRIFFLFPTKNIIKVHSWDLFVTTIVDSQLFFFVLCAEYWKLHGLYLLITCSFLQQVQINDQYGHYWLSDQTVQEHLVLSCSITSVFIFCYWIVLSDENSDKFEY